MATLEFVPAQVLAFPVYRGLYVEKRISVASTGADGASRGPHTAAVSLSGSPCYAEFPPFQREDWFRSAELCMAYVPKSCPSLCPAVRGNEVCEGLWTLRLSQTGSPLMIILERRSAPRFASERGGWHAAFW